MGGGHDQRGHRNERQAGEIKVAIPGIQRDNSEANAALFRKHGVAEGTKISTKGKGRAIGNVFFEHSWRTLKHERLYPTRPADGVELYTTRKRFVHFYNEKGKIQDRESHDSRALPIGRMWHIPPCGERSTNQPSFEFPQTPQKTIPILTYN
jgi:hypothetical protein